MFKNPFDDPRALVERAREHIDEFYAKSKALFHGKVNIATIEVDPKTGEEIHITRFNEPIPTVMPIMVSEAAIHLRHALDQATFASAKMLGNKRLKKTHFPFARYKKELKPPIRNCRDLHPDVVKVCLSFRPYLRGHKYLWGLNQLANANKHTAISVVANAVLKDSGRFAKMWVDGKPGNAQFSMPVWNWRKNAMEIARQSPGTHARYELHYLCEIYFSPSAGVYGKLPVARALDRASRLVEKIIDAIEAETLRIKAG